MVIKVCDVQDRFYRISVQLLVVVQIVDNMTGSICWSLLAISSNNFICCENNCIRVECYLNNCGQLTDRASLGSTLLTGLVHFYLC